MALSCAHVQQGGKVNSRGGEHQQSIILASMYLQNAVCMSVNAAN